MCLQHMKKVILYNINKRKVIFTFLKCDMKWAKIGKSIIETVLREGVSPVVSIPKYDYKKNYPGAMAE
jgi:hypothetical protein